MAEGGEKSAVKAGGPVVLKDRYQIEPSKPLEAFDAPQAKAFRAVDRRQESKELFALVCRSDLPVRTTVMNGLKGTSSPGLIPFEDSGTVYWPPAQEKRTVVVYERPLGGRVFDSMTAVVDPIPELEFARRVIRPLAATLAELSARGLTHRQIRPTNMFWMDSAKQQIVMGDCVTSPAGFDQPVVCEPVESGMASYFGRGNGGAADDIYAVGICLVMLIRGRNPMARQTDEQIIRSKLHYGSYAALVKEERVPLSLIELLRGVLADDSRSRWTTNDFDLWLEGRRLTPLQLAPAKKASIPLKFADSEYTTARELAYGLWKNWDRAAAVIRDGRLEVWLRRGLESKDLVEELQKITRMSAAWGMGSDAGGDDQLIARVCMMLDPNAPIRYKKLAINLDGFGNALAYTVAEGSADARLLAEIINKNVVDAWAETQLRFSAQGGAMIQSVFKDMKGYLQHTHLGYGLERCLYELNDSLACQSPLIKRENINEIRELLPALDAIAKTHDHNAWPVDRHIVAWVLARYGKDMEAQVAALASADKDMQAVGLLSFLAVLQWKLGPEQLLQLTNWVGALSTPILNSYHNRDKRKEFEREIPKIVRKGSLPELYNLLDNAEERQKDVDGFALARAQFSAAEQEVERYQSSDLGRDEETRRTGQMIAAFCSLGIAMITMGMLLFFRLAQ